VDDALFAHGGHGAARLQRWHRGRASHKFQTYSPVGATVFGGFFSSYEMTENCTLGAKCVIHNCLVLSVLQCGDFGKQMR